jgi:hypothetical protein
MCRGCPTAKHFVANNQAVRFVTFNFDTLIEQRLSGALTSAYRYEPPDDVAAALPPVIHVHGSLPEAPTVALAEHPTGGYPDAWVRWICDTPQRINVVHDQIPQETIRAASAAVRNAEVICFLGFAFDLTNVQRLGLPELLASGTRPKMYGSAYAMRDGDRDRVKGMLPNIALSGREAKCVDALLDLYVFRE